MPVDFVKPFTQGWKYLSKKNYDGFDRLSSNYTISVLCGCALIIGGKAYVGDPIDCLEPRESTFQQIKFIDNMCFVKNTFYIPFTEKIPPPDEPRPNVVPYYQWIPIILSFEMFLFAMPWMLWNMALKASGFELEAIIRVCNRKLKRTMHPEQIDQTVKYSVNHLWRSIQFYHCYSVSFGTGIPSFCQLALSRGNFLTLAYAGIKLLCTINALFQIYLLNVFLGGDYLLFGYEYFDSYVTGKAWRASRVFPTVTLCDYALRKMGSNNHVYTLECILPVNMYSEKIFVFLWFWFLFVALMSFIGLLNLIRTACVQTQSNVLSTYLMSKGQLPYQLEKSDHEKMHRFLGHMRQDGRFALLLLAQHSNDYIASGVILGIWEKWCELDKVINL